MKMRLTAASFGLALAAAIFLLVWPVYSGFDGVRTTQATLLQVNGYWALVPVGFPVVIGGFSFISGFSVGLFYLPAAVTMLLAACVPQGLESLARPQQE